MTADPYIEQLLTEAAGGAGFLSAERPAPLAVPPTAPPPSHHERRALVVGIMLLALAFGAGLLVGWWTA